MPESLPNPPGPDEPSPQMPAALQRELRSLYGSRNAAGAPPAALDDTVLQQARLHFDLQSAKPRPAGRGPEQLQADELDNTRQGPHPAGWGLRLRRLRMPLATAAGIAIAVSVAMWAFDVIRRQQLPSISAPPIVAGDVNGDGKLDILDAYLLARQLKQAGTLDSQWDFTRDGQVNEDDVNELTANAVRLSHLPTGVRS